MDNQSKLQIKASIERYTVLSQNLRKMLMTEAGISFERLFTRQCFLYEVLKVENFPKIEAETGRDCHRHKVGQLCVSEESASLVFRLNDCLLRFDRLNGRITESETYLGHSWCALKRKSGDLLSRR